MSNTVGQKTCPERSRKVYVGMSGGVDSSVAALLLKNEGYNVIGVFMKNWSDPAWPCLWQEDRADAMRVCLKLNIPFETWDFTKEYKALVVDYMLREYAVGRTPNPDVMCNKEIKFGLFFEKAISLGADYIATGHYARVAREFPIFNFQFSNSNKLKAKSYKLLRARYLDKDQSYFLWTLKQKQLAKCLFPIGEIDSKAEVRKLAKGAGLSTANKKDSQGICFMGPVDIKEFIKPYVKKEIGDIVTTSGQKIGTHAGLYFYTIGQRKGIGIGGTGPYYVAKKDYETNTLIVSPITDMSALESKELIATNVSFINNDTPSIRSYARCTKEESEKLVKIQASIRYRQEPISAMLSKLESGPSSARWKVVFEKPVRAVASGQSVVFYQGEELLGGGVIE
ncbi:MAG: tRNA 2-thiouridine(34) synthase MnmA [bacterium]|nr:tRNA 2-thiouridine(34) synthase MnmA [bacterium]